MININQENSIEELDKLAKPCSNNLCFSYAQVPNQGHDLTDWYWLFRINGKIYDMLDLSKIPFITHEWNRYVRIEAYSTETFEIDFSKVPKKISEIEVGLNNMGRIRNPMSEIGTFIIKMFDMENKNNIQLTHEFCFKNQRFIGLKNFLMGKQLHIGTFARVNDFWRFYPIMEEVEDIWNYKVYPHEK